MHCIWVVVLKKESVRPPLIFTMIPSAMCLHPFVFLQLQSAGFKTPTPIQAQSWPIAMQNRDIVAIAKTGSGKTLGYLIPAFLHLEQHRTNSRQGPTVLVLAPTRELATQIQDECVKFGRSSRITSTVCCNGYILLLDEPLLLASL